MHLQSQNFYSKIGGGEQSHWQIMGRETRDPISTNGN